MSSRIVQTIRGINDVTELRNALANLTEFVGRDPDTIYTSARTDTGGTLQIQIEETTLTDGSTVYQMVFSADTRTAQEITFDTRKVKRIRRYRRGTTN